LLPILSRISSVNGTRSTHASSKEPESVLVPRHPSSI